VLHYSIPALQETGSPTQEPAIDILSAKFRLRGGEVMISKLNPRKNLVVDVPEDLRDAAVASTEFVVLRPVAIDRRYLSYLLRSDSTRQWLDANARSVTRSHQRVEPELITHLRVRTPEMQEQRRIADFLDDQVARIDNIIAARRTQIRLIESQRMHDLDMLLNEEAHPAARLALFARIQSGITVDAGRDDPDAIEVPYLRVANVQAGALDLTEVKSIRVAAGQVPRYLLRDGDVLMTEGGDIDKLGRGTVWRSEVPGAIHQNHVFAVRVDQTRLLPGYLAYVTAGSRARDYFELTGNRTTNLASTSATKVLDLRIPVRSIVDQFRVVRAAQKADERARVGSALLHASISRAEELKRSLITAALTGKFDVSSADESRVPV
jgi:type I restriction enzyme S subunit